MTSNMNVKAVKGSRLIWRLKFDAEVKSVVMQSMGNDYEMTFEEDQFQRSNTVQKSGF
jgi:hypothetical protein